MIQHLQNQHFDFGLLKIKTTKSAIVPVSGLQTKDWASFKKSCMRTNGSRPFCVNIAHGLGLAKRSETDPCERPSTCSPN